MILSVTNGRIVTATAVLSGADIVVENGLVVAVRPEGGAGDRNAQLDLAGGWLLPGLIDTQVNGGGGVLFNDAINVEEIGRAHV